MKSPCGAVALVWILRVQGLRPAFVDVAAVEGQVLAASRLQNEPARPHRALGFFTLLLSALSVFSWLIACSLLKAAPSACPVSASAALRASIRPR